MRDVYLFTLHQNEEDLEIKAALLASKPSDAVGFWGGTLEQFSDTDRDAQGKGEHRRFDKDGVCVSANHGASLGLCGTVTFAPDLFRDLTDYEVGITGWDSGPVYERSGLVLHNCNPRQEKRLVMRRHAVHIPSPVLSEMAFHQRHGCLAA